ncbi:hypothetical protein M438DRAFT_360065 [Aureobasidium pullulans EXF-150]|uniref:Uncharacterized protein n=1 Tax=Aureobasidium pullulans EXF-150 TaxID=1043002 RepID=A0A074XWF0_AURPU|nr:uncharacterized protein M438DRAFT_360065 [Aureobasidium pullulans EXF-150]KEQ79006.1 hypothetical protein M438DRAFT_360065 [Aureobasidium pullulans EXF-150]
MLNPLRLVLETFGSALGGSPRRSLLSMLNIFEPFFSSTSLGGNNEKRTTRLVQLTELFARKEIAHIRTGDTGTRSTREVVDDRQRAVGDKSARSRNVGSPDVMAHVSPPTLGRHIVKPLVDEDMAVEQDQVSRCKWIRRMASEFWYNSARQGVEAYDDSTCFDAGSLVISEQHPSRELFNTKMIE